MISAPSVKGQNTGKTIAGRMWPAVGVIELIIRTMLVRLLLDPIAPDRTVLQLEPGQRYGWCEEHDQSGKHAVGMVHDVVNENRDRILLGTGSMMSLDLARSLKRSFGMLKIPVKVSGLGGTPTYITSEARVMVTLGGWMAMVYVLDVWLTNIGEG
ncbi:hypothetical protein JG687_00017801 [Phytophthora cactorum]|nr:hypothetical protein JG687_00017801 [Phytophthora cactorum]